jgi:hypothetical protein
MLIGKGVDVNYRGYEGITPLHCAASSEHARLLIDAGASVDALDRKGNPPLFFARTYEIVKLLLKKGASLHVKNNRGDTVIFEYLYENSRSEVLIAVLEVGANFESRNILGETPIVTAARLGLSEHFEILYKRGADLFFVKDAHNNNTGDVWKYVKDPSHPLYKSDYYYALKPKGIFNIF